MDKYHQEQEDDLGVECPFKAPLCIQPKTLCVCVMQEMALAWEEYSRLESSVEQLRMALQAHMNHSATPQVTPGTAAQITFVIPAVSV